MTTRFFEDTEIYRKHFLEDVPAPRLAILDSSSLCNLKCPMCPRTIDRSPAGPRFANLDRRVMEELGPALGGFEEVVLSWIGEPLVNTRILEIVRFVKSQGPKVHITTNGVLLTRARAEGLIDAGLDSIAISIDGARPETYRRYRVGGELEEVCANVSGLVEARRARGVQHPRISIAFVAMPGNVTELAEMVELASRLGIGLLTVDVVDDFTLTEEFGLGQEALGEVRQDASRAFHDAVAKAHELGVEISFPSIRLFHEVGEWPLGEPIDARYFTNDYAPEDLAREGLRKGCGLPWADVVIGFNGDVHPCCVSSRVLGNVLETPFQEIWHGAPYQEFRRRLKSTAPPEECRSCRRAIWNGSTPTEEVGRRIEVGQSEVYGRGWGPLGRDALRRPYRPVKGEATLFLKNDGQGFLTMRLAPGGWAHAEGDVTVDGTPAGRFRIRPGWHKLFFPLRPSSEQFRTVTITHRTRGQELLFHCAELEPSGYRLQAARLRNLVWESINRVRLWFVSRP
ncbi:MAG: radical SAM protein [Acidobacteriota bacterium]